MTQRIGMYFSWDRNEEIAAPLGVLDNRFPALFELRRQFWPLYESLADAPGGQDIEGYLNAVFFKNYALFVERAAAHTGWQVDQIERSSSSGPTPITDALLGCYDCLILISFDSKRTRQAITSDETRAVRSFLARPGTTLLVCPHHDIGDVDALRSEEALERQTAEFRHHGDVVLPGQQRTGGFALSVMAALGAPIVNRFGLRPATNEDGSPVPFRLSSEDRHGLLAGVPFLNLHSHLPQLSPAGTASARLEVLAQQQVSGTAPSHPVVRPGSFFDSILQARSDAGLGRLFVCDPTVFTSTNGGTQGLEVLWKNILNLD